ncbi:MAG TPA: nucleotidyltransferase domain-containing protein [Alphaproteobacteria bacterium]|nr:nucleotidyltransferase domain-containing protein [Alphaproteobacteria bacterium]HOO50715.1 nucleotidyltransferase domain-containing protein [Alphaproteobacteria bacterium]
MIDITDKDIKIIKGIVSLICPDAKLYAFGSRVTGDAKPVSDLDVVLKSDHKISMTDILDIKELLKASPLLFSVDVMDWNSLGEGFRQSIEKDLREII